MKRYFAILFWMITILSVYAQDVTKVDSLKNVLGTYKKQDTVSVSLMIEIAQALKDNDNNQSLMWAEKADSRAKEIHYLKGEMKAKSMIAWRHYQLGNYDLCFEFSSKALKIAEQINDFRETVAILNSLGAAYFSQQNYKEAIVYLKKGYQIAEQNKIHDQAGRSLNNIAFMLYKDGLLQEAEKAGKQALKYNLQYKNDAFASVAMRTLGDIELQQKKYDKAKKYYTNSLAICEEIQSNILTINVLIRLGKVNIEKKNYQEAISYLLRTENLSRQYSYRDELLESYQRLSYSYKENDQIREAFNYLEKYKALYDSIYNDKNAKRIQELSSQFETEKKQAQIELLNKEKIIQDEYLEIQKLVNYGLGIGLFLVLCGAGYVFYSYNEKQKMNALLIEQKEELTKKHEEVEIQAEELTQTNNAMLVANEEINKKNHNITASINYAKKIQSALLPSKPIVDSFFGVENYFLLYKPKDILSGDFYWVSERAEDSSFCFVLADCTGHGVPGALMSIIGCELLHQIVNMQKIYQPNEILNQLRKELVKVLHQDEVDNQDGMDLVVLKIDTSNQKVYFASAMNSLYYLQPSISNQLQEIKGDKIMIGGGRRKKDNNFTLQEIDISNQTFFYLTSDGFKDQFGGMKNKKYSPKRLRNKLQEIYDQPLSIQKNVLENELENWMIEGAEPQTDDIALFGFVL